MASLGFLIMLTDKMFGLSKIYGTCSEFMDKISGRCSIIKFAKNIDPDRGYALTSKCLTIIISI